MNSGSAERWLGGGLIVLVGILPFHAFLATWLGHLFGSREIIQAWKEVLILLLAGTAAVQLWQRPGLRSGLTVRV